MQPQPTSVFIHADAYRQGLLADAERTRPKLPRDRRDRASSRSSPGWLRRRAGTVLVRAGERLRGAPDTAPAAGAAGANR
jgi:hypothetical protein